MPLGVCNVVSSWLSDTALQLRRGRPKSEQVCDAVERVLDEEIKSIQRWHQMLSQFVEIGNKELGQLEQALFSSTNSLYSAAHTAAGAEHADPVCSPGAHAAEPHIAGRGHRGEGPQSQGWHTLPHPRAGLQHTHADDHTSPTRWAVNTHTEA